MLSRETVKSTSVLCKGRKRTHHIGVIFTSMRIWVGNPLDVDAVWVAGVPTYLSRILSISETVFEVFRKNCFQKNFVRCYDFLKRLDLDKITLWLFLLFFRLLLGI